MGSSALDDQPGAANLIGLLGCTLNCTATHQTIYAIADLDPFSATSASQVFLSVNLNSGTGNTTSGILTKTDSGSVLGNLLVRKTSVPEPASIGLFGVDLAGPGFLKRRKARA